MGFRDFERFKVSLYFFRLHGDPPGENWKQKHRSLLTNFHWCFVYRRDLNSKIPQSLDTDVQRPFYSVAIVALLPYMGRERRCPRWIKKASHIGSKRLCKIRIYLRELAAVIILVAPSKMLIQHYNDEISVRLRWHVMYKRIRKWICWVSQVRLHLAGSTVKIRHWQIWPYHWLDSTIKKRHIPHLGAFLHNPETPVHRSFQVSRSKCIGMIAFAKYSSQSVKTCTVVTDRRHKLETSPTVTPVTENTEHSTRFA